LSRPGISKQSHEEILHDIQVFRNFWGTDFAP